MDTTTAPAAPTDLILKFASLALEPATISPARIREADQRRAYRREAQVRLNVVGLPRGLRLAA